MPSIFLESPGPGEPQTHPAWSCALPCPAVGQPREVLCLQEGGGDVKRLGMRRWTRKEAVLLASFCHFQHNAKCDAARIATALVQWRKGVTSKAALQSMKNHLGFKQGFSVQPPQSIVALYRDTPVAAHCQSISDAYLYPHSTPVPQESLG